MKYFIDTEFLEGTQDKRFLGIKYGKTPPTIDLISIGIVAEDGREYYAISNEFNLYEAWNRHELENDNSVGARIGVLPPEKKIYWIRENVLRPIWNDEVLKMHAFTNLKEDINWEFAEFNYKNFKKLIGLKGKTNSQISNEILSFTKTTTDRSFKPNKQLSFYGYFADYDWVVFCWIFGKMIDLPEGFPMLCNDIQQELISRNIKRSDIPFQDDKHHALEDAKWNKLVYETLLSDGK